MIRLETQTSHRDIVTVCLSFWSSSVSLCFQYKILSILVCCTLLPLFDVMSEEFRDIAVRSNKSKRRIYIFLSMHF